MSPWRATPHFIRFRTMLYFFCDISQKIAFEILEFMEAKSFQNGPLKLIHYSISTSPEWKEHTTFLEGKMPEKTGRFVVTLFEIYETEEGLHHHWIESKEIQPIFETWPKEIGGVIKIHSHQKIVQSLWD